MEFVLFVDGQSQEMYDYLSSIYTRPCYQYGNSISKCCSRWADLEEESEEEEAPRKKKKRKKDEAEAEADPASDSKTGKVANRSSAAPILKQVGLFHSSCPVPANIWILANLLHTNLL